MLNDKIRDLIQDTYQHTSSPIHIHISRNFWESNTQKRAKRLFKIYQLDRAPKKNGFLIYLNLRSHKYALVTDSGFSQKAGEKLLSKLSKTFNEDLLSTHYENSLLLLVQLLNITYKKHFSKNS
jgi:uncharacterized membrane protein